MSGRKLLLVFSLILLVLVSACGKKNAGDDPVGQTGDVPREDAGEPGVYPLTGLESDGPVDQRIVGVMVNNQVQARPQSGLSKADLVFEILAEGDITRFLAFFQSEQPEVVGPVRSAREYYVDLAKDYGSIYVYHGAADFVNELIDESGMDYLNGSFYDNDGNLFKRESFRQAPHNSYLQFKAVMEVAEDKGFDTRENVSLSLPFLAGMEEVSGESAEDVSVNYIGQNPSHVVQYKYNEAQAVYDRYEDQEQTVELGSHEPIQVSNVLIMEAPHEVIDKQGRRAIDFESGGQAYLLQGGKVQEVNWVNQGGQIIPVKEGEQVGFLPGKTWINVVPSDPGLDASVNFQ